MRAFVVILTLLGAVSVAACGGPDYRVSADRRGEVNGRSFELVSTRVDGDEWSFRARGDSLWVGYVRDGKIGELGELTLTDAQTARLWDLIDEVDVGGRRRGQVDRKRGTVTLRLSEPDDDGGHTLRTALVSRKTTDDDVLALAEYLIELVRLHTKMEPAL